MTKLALYRKYRPGGFEDLYGQDHISQTLKNAIKSERFSHAYLFTGPRGVGKTSVARILAKAINCEDEKDGEPCNKCEKCKGISEGREIDIAEIDAASNRGIDEIRDLREKVKFAPSNLSYKVFIIDEVHMLTKEAFNALLKTLEEPPSHAIFVLATTEIHKIPQTIISRTQRFDFKRINIKDQVERLEYIAKEEKIDIDDSALAMIAEASEGGFRDAISYLDQISAYKSGKISLEDTISILGMSDFGTLFKFVELIKNNDSKEAIILLNDLAKNGIDMEQFSKNIIEFLRKILLVKTIGGEKVELIKEHEAEIKGLTEELSVNKISIMIEVIIDLSKAFKGASVPQLPLEIAVVKLTNNIVKEEESEGLKEEAEEALDKEKTLEPGGFAYKEKNIEKRENKGIEREEVEKKNSTKFEKKTIVIEKNSDPLWCEFLIEVKSKNSSLHAFIKVSDPSFAEDMLVLKFPYRFHKDKVMEPKNKKLVEEILIMVYNKPYKLKCYLNESGKKTTKEEVGERKEDDKLVSSALDIFGGEIIE